MSAETTSQLRKYEAVIIMHPDCSEEDQKTLFRKNRDIIKQFKGTINHLDTWGKRKLANPIEKFSRGVFFHATFEARGEAISELERTMRINDNVLRFTHTRLDDRISLAKFVEGFKTVLAETAQRERDREAKFQAQRKAFGSGGFGGRGGDRDRGDRGDRGEGRGGDRDGGGFRGRRDHVEREEPSDDAAETEE